MARKPIVVWESCLQKLCADMATRKPVESYLLNLWLLSCRALSSRPGEIATRLTVDLLTEPSPFLPRDEMEMTRMELILRSTAQPRCPEESLKASFGLASLFSSDQNPVTSIANMVSIVDGLSELLSYSCHDNASSHRTPLLTTTPKIQEADTQFNTTTT